MATQAIPQAETRKGFDINLNVRDWRIRTKLLWLLLIFGVVPFAMVGGLTFRVFRETVSHQASAGLYAHTVKTTNAVDQYLVDKREDIVAASKLPEVVAYLSNPNDATAKTNALKSLEALAARADYESIAIVPPEGKTSLSSYPSDVGTDVSFRGYFQEPMKGTASFISDPTVSVVTNRPAIFFSAPVKDASNKVIGVIRSRLSLDGLWGLIERDKDSEGLGSYGMLLDENGIRIANSQSLGRRAEMEGSLLLYTAVGPVSAEVEKQLVAEKRFGNATSTKVQVVPIPEVARALVTPETKTFETSSDSNTEVNFAAVAGVSTKPWRYVIMSPWSSFYGEVDGWGRVYSIATAILILVIGITSIFVARTFTNPLNQLTQVADRISLGELNAQIGMSRKDEIGELADAVGRMQASLQAAIERLRARRASQ